jgi:hypothetical protein
MEIAIEISISLSIYQKVFGNIVIVIDIKITNIAQVYQTLQIPLTFTKPSTRTIPHTILQIRFLSDMKIEHLHGQLCCIRFTVLFSVTSYARQGIGCRSDLHVNRMPRQIRWESDRVSYQNRIT